MLRRDAVLDGLPATVGKPGGWILQDPGSETKSAALFRYYVLTAQFRKTTSKRQAVYNEKGRFNKHYNEVAPKSIKAPSSRAPFVVTSFGPEWQDGRRSLSAEAHHEFTN